MNKPSYLLFKQCSKCGEIKHINRFSKSKKGKYGVSKRCKECDKIYREENKEFILLKQKEWRDNNKEYIKEKNKQYYEEYKEELKEKNKQYYEEHKEEWSFKNKQYREENKEFILLKQKEWRDNNKEIKRELNKKYYQEHKEELCEYHKKWRENNPEKVFNYHNERRNKLENQGNGITQEQWYEMMEFFDWKCAYSGEKLGGDSDKRTIDHIVALDNGGEHEIWNCIPCYANYNYNKHTNNMLEWYLEQDYFDINRLTKIYEWRIYAYWKWNEKESV